MYTPFSLACESTEFYGLGALINGWPNVLARRTVQHCVKQSSWLLSYIIQSEQATTNKAGLLHCYTICKYVCTVTILTHIQDKNQGCYGHHTPHNSCLFFCRFWNKADNSYQVLSVLLRLLNWSQCLCLWKLYSLQANAQHNCISNTCM